jgi:hypothetical protein
MRRAAGAAKQHAEVIGGVVGRQGVYGEPVVQSREE